MACSLDLERQNLPDWAVLGTTTFALTFCLHPGKGELEGVGWLMVVSVAGLSLPGQ